MRKAKIHFPPEDSGWLALQQAVISVAEKPIEDLARHEVRALGAVLTPDEQRKLREYRRRNGLDKLGPALSAGLKPWSEQRCTQTFGWIADFVELVGYISGTIQFVYSHHRSDYADVLTAFEPRLLEFLDTNSERPDLKEKYDVFIRMSHGIAKVTPTDAGYDLLDDLLDALRAREEEIENKEKKASEPAGPWPLPKGWLFFVVFSHVKAHRRECYVVWALDEKDAHQKALAKFHAQFPKVAANGWPVEAGWGGVYTKPERCERGDSRWQQYFENGGKCQ